MRGDDTNARLEVRAIKGSNALAERPSPPSPLSASGSRSDPGILGFAGREAAGGERGNSARF